MFVVAAAAAGFGRTNSIAARGCDKKNAIYDVARCMGCSKLGLGAPFVNISSVRCEVMPHSATRRVKGDVTKKTTA